MVAVYRRHRLAAVADPARPPCAPVFWLVVSFEVLVIRVLGFLIERKGAVEEDKKKWKSDSERKEVRCESRSFKLMFTAI